MSGSIGSTGAATKNKDGAVVVVDISDVQVTDDPNVVLATYALGSCIGVVAYDRKRCVGGMLHYMLPLSRTNPTRAKERPAMFADTGLPLLFEKMYAFGCDKSDIIVKVVGGGQLYDDRGTFDIGRRNYAILNKIFKNNGVKVLAEDVGGTASRSVRMLVGTGDVVVRSHGREATL